MNTGSGKYTLCMNSDNSIEVYTGPQKQANSIGHLVGVVEDLNRYDIEADNECFVVSREGEKAVINDATKRGEIVSFSYPVIRDNQGQLRILPMARSVEGSLEMLAQQFANALK